MVKTTNKVCRTYPKVQTPIKWSDKVACNLALSLLPGLKAILPLKQYNRIQGLLRRGDLSACQDSYLLGLLSNFRTGFTRTNVTTFRAVYQFVSLFKKTPWPGDDESCRLAALEKFKKGEQQCLVTNNRMRSIDQIPSEVLTEAKTIIFNILGDFPDDNYLFRTIDFGPGSNVNPVSRPYKESSDFYKLTDKLLVYSSGYHDLCHLLISNPLWIRELGNFYGLAIDLPYSQLCEQVLSKHIIIVDNKFPNKLTFVPKDQNEHRTIGVELNGMILLQKCIGNQIRQRLFDVGLNLNQQNRNKHMARLAKVFSLATVDLSNASNTLAFETVKFLLPPAWFSILASYRSSYGATKDGFSVRYEMFSSMGNGFTFELESLIFYAIALACTGGLKPSVQRQVAVFGDDIILPSNHYPKLVLALEEAGFSVNTEKSFVDGYFFESCGSDFFDSSDVRPFFLKRPLASVRDYYFFCNSLLHHIIRSKDKFLFPLYIRALKEILKTVNPLFGPLHFAEERIEWNKVHDDLEAFLCVPLEFAQANGGVSFDYSLFAWRFKRNVRVAVYIPLTKRRDDPIVDAIKYLCFMRGNRHGESTYKGITRDRVKTAVTSSWNGTLSPVDLSLIQELFSCVSSESAT